MQRVRSANHSMKSDQRKKEESCKDAATGKKIQKNLCDQRIEY